MAWTNEQMDAINRDNSNIIVSAGAGSGKTAVLTERVIRKLKGGVDVDRLLVLTFTNEAANEMKSRIRDAIIKNGMDDQLSLLDSSYITTFDSYALSIVKKYHYLLNVSNNVSIVDSNIVLIYKYKIIDLIFEEMYGNTKFNKLVDDFCLKDDKKLKQYVLMFYDKLDLLIDKNKYLDNYMNDYYSDEFINQMINLYMDLIRNKIEELRDLYIRFQSFITSKLSDKLNAYFSSLFDGNSYDDYVLFTKVSSVRFIGVDESGIKLKELVKEKVDEIKNLLRFESIDEIRDSIRATADYVEVMIDIVRKLDLEVLKYKQDHDIYEFNDIAHMAIKVVAENEDVRCELREFFNEIMVDEYQDTSSIQEEFIGLISNNNVYMVGDIKQSIYRFRNANPYIFQDKYDNYAKGNGGIKIDLLKNFRSRRETLFNINEMFNLIMDNEIGNANYLESHNMMYGNTAYDLEDTHENNYLEIYNYNTQEDDGFSKEEKEIFIIAEDIIDKIERKYQVFDKKTGKLRDINYSDICIITDRNKYLDKYKKILEYKGISSVLYKDEDLTSDDLILVIKNLIALVYYVNNRIYDSKFRYLFTAVARSFLFEYSDDKIYQIFHNNSFKDDDIIKKCYEIDLCMPLSSVIISIIDKFMIYDNLTKLVDIDKSLIRISNLLDIANNLDSLGYDIISFVNYIDSVIENGLTVKYSSNTSSGDAVKIMNIHKSKGLEFSLCYFTGMHNKFTIKEIKDTVLFSTKYGMIFPYMKEELVDTILKDLYVDNYYLEEVSEKIRLFYVAVTRCREKMIIVTSLPDNSERFSRLVPYDERIKYRSFLDIINSISVIEKYIVPKEAVYSKEYDDTKIKDINVDSMDSVIEKKKIDLNYEIVNKKKFSKAVKKVFNKDEIRAIEYGLSMHEMLEYSDFNTDRNNYIVNLLNKVDNNYINIYREYEFICVNGNEESKGIIDLMIEYEDSISIIDYKLKNIDDSEYVKQLKGYKKYIRTISDKIVRTYLYSIITDELKEID